MRVERARKVGYGGGSSNSPGILSIAVQPGGQRVATGGEDGRTRIWQLDCLRPLEHSSALLALLAEHTSSVTCVRFAPRSDLLASSSSDSSVVVSLHYPNRAPRCLLHLLARRSREGRCKACYYFSFGFVPFPFPLMLLLSTTGRTPAIWPRAVTIALSLYCLHASPFSLSHNKGECNANYRFCCRHSC